jgi:peptidoglycan hydrolase-like protein with peptidoglycan-binding domain
METRTKFILAGSAIVAIGGGYLLYKYVTKNGSKRTTGDFEDAIRENDLPTPSSSGSSSPSPAVVHKPKAPAVVYNAFPLKYGSKGTTVRDLQTALNNKYGTKIDVDGDWRGQTESALKSNGLPTTIDSETYAKLILGTYGKAKTDDGDTDKEKNTEKESKSSDSVDPLVSELVNALSGRDIFATVRVLGKIKDVTHYIKINEKFKTKRIHGNTRATIPTALNRVFMFDPERTKYRAQLYRIGLKWRNSKWALAGFIGSIPNRLVTLKRTKIWDAKGNFLIVPRATIVGSFVQAKNGLTEFQTIDGRRLFVNTTEIRYHD